MIDDSKCTKSILCGFEISRDLPDALVEICKFCGKKVVYNRKNGKIDDKKYLRDHLRDTVQPYGRTHKLFIQIYGTEPLKEVENWGEKRKMKEKLKRNREEVQEKRKFIYKGRTPPSLIKRTGFQRL